MKNKKFIKISALILTLSLCVGMLLPFSVSAETSAQTETTPDIYSQNVKYDEKFCLMYAVDAATVAGGSVKLYLYEADPASGAKPKRVYDNPIYAEMGDTTYNPPRDSYIFITEGVAAYAMGQDFYVQAEDAQGNKSAVKKYSVGLYLYERLASSDATVEQRNFYNSTLTFGAYAQKVIAKETDETKYINNYCYVTSIDETTINGFGSGIYSKGSTVTLAKDGADKLTAIAYDADGGYIPKITGDSYTIPTNAVSVEVSAGNRIIYRDQRITFEDLDVGETNDSKTFYPESLNEGHYGVVATADHGKAYSVTFDKAGSLIYKWSPSTDIVSADKATAVEFSFDIKVSFDSTANTSSSPFFTLFDQKYDNGSGAFRTQASFISEDKHLQLMNQATGYPRATYEDVHLNEWFHVRAVYYEGDASMYVYINGSDVPFVNNKPDSKNYTGDISTLSRARITSYSTAGVGFTVQIDNLFYGFTMDKNPNAQ